MVKFFIKIYDFLINRRSLVWVILVAVFALFALTQLNLNYSEDIADFLPVTKENKKYTSVYNNLGGQNRIVLMYSYKGDSLRNAVDSVSSAMDEFRQEFCSSSLREYDSSLSIDIDESDFLDIIDFVNENAVFFLSDSDYDRIEQLLANEQYVAQQLENNKKLLMLPTGGMIANNLRYDPLHLFSPVLQRFQSTRLNNEYDVVNGHLFNRNHTNGLAFFSSPFGLSESKENQQLLNVLDSVIVNVGKRCPNVEISTVGAPVIAVTNASQIKKDSLFGLSIAVVLILALLVYSFRRLDDLFWIVASISFGWLFALSAISLIWNNISIIVIGIGSIIIGIAVNYPLHYLDHIKHELDKRTALKEMVTPLLIGNITTVSAFLCLLALDAQAMKGLGLFGGLTLVGTIIFVLVFLPVLVRPRVAGKSYFNVDFTINHKLSKLQQRTVFVLFLALTLLFAYFSFKTSFDSDIQNINYMTEQQRSNLKELSDNMGNKGMSLVYAVAEDSTLQGAIYNNEILVNDIKKTVGDNVMISGINGFLPSREHQLNRIEKWKSFWSNYPNLLENINKEGARLGFQGKAFEQFENSINAQYSVQDAEYFEPVLKLFAESYIQKVDSVYRVVNFVNIADSLSTAVKQGVNSSGNGRIFAFDAKDVGNQLVKILSDSFNYIGFICGFIVFFFLWLSFGRLELSLISFLPLTVSWFWILGIMFLTDVQFNIVNIILATLIFGQGDDYTIFITEGLMYEYAYGKKTLKSYKNSIAISAIIMLIGIGALIFSKHPAMRSLAMVSIIGMLTVLVMTYYLPPLIFRWLVSYKGKIRQVPITIERILFSLVSILFFIISAYLFMYPVMFIFFTLCKVTEKSRLRYHGIIRWYANFVIRRVPGVKFSLSNRFGEDFEKPAVIVANHQSHLDLMCLLMLDKKIIILTNDWVWNNPLYGRIIKKAEFYPVSNGVENHVEQLKSLVDRGYSIVVFPEGTRSADCSILRFHKGAFYLAQYLNVDIVPVVIHGAGEVLAKTDFMLRRGAIHVEVEKRIAAESFCNVNCKDLTQQMRRFFKTRLLEIAEERADAEYYSHYVRYKYLYKGRQVERECSRQLKRIKSFDAVIKDGKNSLEQVAVINSGQGEFAWLYALVHKNIEVYAFERDEDRYLIAANTSDIPCNLHFEHVDNYNLVDRTKFGNVVDLSEV